MNALLIAEALRGAAILSSLLVGLVWLGMVM